MKELLKNKWAWAVCILVVINVATIGAIWCSMCGRGNKMECQRDQRFHHHGGHERGGEFKHGQHGPKGEDFLAKELNLTEEQKISFEALRKEHFEKMKANVDSMQALKKEMMKSLGKTDAEINAGIQKIGALEMSIQRETFDHFNKMYALCTDAQKVLLKEKLENVMDHRGPGFAPGSERYGRNHHHGYKETGGKSCCPMHGDSAKTH
ncbi:MAG TPA: Spy/CpxP family protein refolding chaperone [Cytophaga sp.]|jgi:Spy/CpxP family protein refolding chaperone|nr:Spy/CpxP family protein refolding chaperone [Cytophaga sp.]